VANGEQHPLLTVIAEHSVALLAVIRGMVPDSGVPGSGVAGSGVSDSGVPDSGVPDSGVPDSGVPDAGLPDGRYQGIPIVVEPVTVED
jgi:hypothetical protein